MKANNLQKYVYSKEFFIQHLHITKQVREEYQNNKHNLKREVIKDLHDSGYFDNTPLTVYERKCLEKGYIPKRGKSNMFSMHHIIPISLNGNNRFSNLVPLPCGFHRFIHNKIFDPQIKGRQTGTKVRVYMLPDFNKLPFEWFMNPKFIQDYWTMLSNRSNLNQKKIMETIERQYT